MGGYTPVGWMDFRSTADNVHGVQNNVPGIVEGAGVMGAGVNIAAPRA